MRAIEKANNLKVGPGSYDPQLKPKLNTVNNTDWALGPPRFPEEKPPEHPDDFMYQQYNTQRARRSPVVPRSHSGHASHVQTQAGSKQVISSNQGSHGGYVDPHQAHVHQPSQQEFSLHQNISAGEQSFDQQQKQEFTQAAALQAQVRVFQKHKHDATTHSMTRSLSVSGKEGHAITQPRQVDEDPNFERDEGGIQNLMHGHQSSHQNMPDVHSPSRTLIKNMSDSFDKSPKQPHLYKQSTTKLYAQENLERSLKEAKDDAAQW